MESIQKQIEKLKREDKNEVQKFSNQDIYDLQMRVYKLEEFLSEMLEYKISRIKIKRIINAKFGKFIDKV